LRHLFFLESVVQLDNQIVVACCDSEIVNVNAEVDALAVWVDFEEGARVVDGSAVAFAQLKGDHLSRVRS
jgi:hypothetical protein